MLDTCAHPSVYGNIPLLAVSARVCYPVAIFRLQSLNYNSTIYYIPYIIHSSKYSPNIPQKNRRGTSIPPFPFNLHSSFTKSCQANENWSPIITIAIFFVPQRLMTYKSRNVKILPLSTFLVYIIGDWLAMETCLHHHTEDTTSIDFTTHFQRAPDFEVWHWILACPESETVVLLCSVRIRSACSSGSCWIGGGQTVTPNAFIFGSCRLLRGADRAVLGKRRLCAVMKKKVINNHDDYMVE